jgi:hypothetical protein
MQQQQCMSPRKLLQTRLRVVPGGHLHSSFPTASKNSELIDSGAQRQQLSNYSKQKLPAVINVIATMAVTREKRCPDSKAQMLLISQLNCSRCHISQVYICCLSVFQTLDGGTVLRPLEGRH